MNQYPILQEKELSPEQQELRRRMQLVTSSRAKLMLMSLNNISAPAQVEKDTTNMLQLMSHVQFGD